MDNKKLIGVVLLFAVVYFFWKWWNDDAMAGGGSITDLPDITGETDGEANGDGGGYSGGQDNGETNGSGSSGASASNNWCGIYDEGISGGVAGNGVCGSTGRYGNIPHIVADPKNPNETPSLYKTKNNPLAPTMATDSGLEIGCCVNPLNNNSTYISILTGSIMPVTSILTFLDNMRAGYNNSENNPNSSGCRFLRLRQTHHLNELNGTITSPNHKAIKQAKVDFLTATINNCCNEDTKTTLNRTKTI